MTTDRLLKDAAAADLLGITPNALAVWRCKGKGPHFVKLGRSVRYRESDIQSYIAGLE